MRIAFISDIHGNQPALSAVLDDLDPETIAEIYCAGDIVGYYAFPNEVIEEIREENIMAIKGNHDEAILSDTPSNFSIPAKRAADWSRRNLTDKNIEFLGQLGNNIRRSKDGHDIYITHGSPADNINEYIHEEEVTERRLRQWFSDIPDVVVLGHTHVQMTTKINETIIANPGSVGQPRDNDPRAGYAIFDTESSAIESYRVKYDIDSTVAETQKELPKKLADRLYHGK